MSAPTTNVKTWDTNDFMQFISSLKIKGSKYDQIKKEMEDNGLSVSDIKGTVQEFASLFAIPSIIAKKIRKALYDRRLKDGFSSKPVPNIPEGKENETGNGSINNNSQFAVNLRGNQGKMTTLRKLFTANSLVGDVVQAYKDEECGDLNYKVEKIILTSNRKILKHDKKLGDPEYNITNEHNLITVVFKTKGGADFTTRTVDEWTAEDIQSWIMTLNFKTETEQQILSSIDENGFVGADLVEESCADIAEALAITNEAAQKLFDAMRSWKVIEQNDNNNNDNDLYEKKSDPNPTLQYYVGYKLDCKDFAGVWCEAEIIDIDEYCDINIKFTNWRNNGTNSGFWEATINYSQTEQRFIEYGIITNKDSGAIAVGTKENTSNYSPNAKFVYKTKRSVHPSQGQAQEVRQFQSQQLETLKNGNQPAGIWHTVSTAASAVGSYISGDNKNKKNKNKKNDNKNSRNKNSHNKNYHKKDYISGIIGLRNLGNQCYMNSAIQLIVQTPALLKLFRNTTKNSRKPLLTQFIDLCDKAKGSSCTYKPTQIKSILSKEDHESFSDYSQQDAGHAFSTFLAKLDEELLDNKDYQSGLLTKFYDNGLDSDMEQVLIENIMDEYNPKNKSIIRDAMTFVFREIYSCLAPNCDYVQWRYNLSDKLVLPLKNHFITIPCQIYICHSSFKQQFNCLSYCSVSTLTGQIHAYLRNKSKSKDQKYDIYLYEMQNPRYNQLIDPNETLKPIPSNAKCDELVDKVIFAMATRSNTDTEMKESDGNRKTTLMIKQFEICIDKKGKVNKLHCRVVPTAIGTNINELSINTKSNIWRYYKGRIINKNDLIIVEPNCDSVVIVYVESSKTQCIKFMEDGYDKINKLLKWYEMTDSKFKSKSIIDYDKIARDLQSRQKIYVDSDVTIAIDCYVKMANNQMLVSKYLCDALKLYSNNKCHKLYRGVLKNINDCWNTYFAEQVLESGAQINCPNCKSKCKVFTKNIEIVRLPNIMTILFDRFNNGRKYDHKISFSKAMNLNTTKYGLYGVCNHSSSSTDYGHYYSYVKSIDKNDYVWYNANDARINPIRNENEINNNRNALILMFEKQSI